MTISQIQKLSNLQIALQEYTSRLISERQLKQALREVNNAYEDMEDQEFAAQAEQAKQDAFEAGRKISN